MKREAQRANQTVDEWLKYLQEVVQTIRSGDRIAPGAVPDRRTSPRPAADRPSPTVVYSAPHPDDEALSGGLALRLAREGGVRVTHVAITLGSDPTQRQRRLHELESACAVLGFQLVVPAYPVGFTNVTTEARRQHPERWASAVKELAAIFDREKPCLVFAPHAEDFNTTHIGTHFLVAEALSRHLTRTRRGPVLFVQTEFWQQMRNPNLMVGLAPETVALQLAAASQHRGEMKRNPYHLLHACRLMDNVRRGSEVVGGQGAAVQPFTFAELFRVTWITHRRRSSGMESEGARHILPPGERADLRWLAECFPPPDSTRPAPRRGWQTATSRSP